MPASKLVSNAIKVAENVLRSSSTKIKINDDQNNI